MKRFGPTRKEFLEDVALGVAGVTLGLPLLTGASASAATSEMPYRTLGRTGEKISVLGLGGVQLGFFQDEAESIRFVRTAIDNGITYVEGSWDYFKGMCDERIGKALRDGYRKKVFLATKIDGRSKERAAAQLDDCLKRLGTDMIDLIQFHEVVYMEEPERIFGPGGAVEAVLAAKKAGKVRFIGFTGHYHPDVHLKLLDTAFKRGFRFDTGMIPLNVMDAHYNSFAKKMVPALRKQDIGILGFKSLGGGTFVGKVTPGINPVVGRFKITPAECIRYSMSLPTAAVISGMGSFDELNRNLETACSFRPMSEPEVARLLAKTADSGAAGEYEWFKGPAGLAHKLGQGDYA